MASRQHYVKPPMLEDDPDFDAAKHQQLLNTVLGGQNGKRVALPGIEGTYENPNKLVKKHEKTESLHGSTHEAAE